MGEVDSSLSLSLVQKRLNRLAKTWIIPIVRPISRSPRSWSGASNDVIDGLEYFSHDVPRS